MHNTTQDISIAVEDLSQVKKKLDIVIPTGVVNKELSAAYRTLKTTAAIAGFRKGAVPLNILKARFGDRVSEDVATKLIESSYPHALHEKQFVPVERPKIEIKSPKLEEGKEFSYSVTVEVNPHLEIEDYRGMVLDSEKIEVSEKDVEEGLERLRQSRAEYKDVERASKEGDMVVVDFDASVDGATVKGSQTTDFTAIIGNKTFLPGFEEAITGVSKGEKKQALIPFPANYSEGNLAGKEGLFYITVKAVKEKTVPVLDEEFAKDIECDNLEKLKARVKEELSKIKESHEKERVKNLILDRLIGKYPFEVPEALVNKYLAVNLSRVLDSMRQGFGSPEDIKLTPDDLKAKYRVIAVRQVREDIILDAIAAREKLEVSREEVDASIKKLAESRNVPYEALMGRIVREGTLEIIKDGLKHEKVFDIIIGAAKGAA